MKAAARTWIKKSPYAKVFALELDWIFVEIIIATTHKPMPFFVNFCFLCSSIICCHRAACVIASEKYCALADYAQAELGDNLGLTIVLQMISKG